MEQELATRSAPLTTTFHEIEEAAARIKGAVYESPAIHPAKRATDEDSSQAR
jgi:hypothetical protein